MSSNFRERGKGIRSRIICRYCGRSIAITFNGHTGDAYVRTHVEAPGQRCAGSQKTIPSFLVAAKVKAERERQP